MSIDISSVAKPKNVIRIGERPQGNRPLKVEFRDAVERDDILEKLHKFVNNGKYKSISITENLTNLERNTVKSWLALAKEKNTKEP